MAYHFLLTILNGHRQAAPVGTCQTRLAEDAGRSMSTVQEWPGRTLRVGRPTQRAGLHILSNKHIQGAKLHQPPPNDVFLNCTGNSGQQWEGAFWAWLMMIWFSKSQMEWAPVVLFRWWPPLQQCGQNDRYWATWLTREHRVSFLILPLARLIPPVFIPEMSCPLRLKNLLLILSQKLDTQ